MRIQGKINNSVLGLEEASPPHTHTHTNSYSKISCLRFVTGENSTTQPELDKW